jgi:5-methylcytosine-specific restriction enzyme subunit McrC
VIHIDLREGARERETALTPAQAALLAATEVVRITRGSRPGVWRVRDNGLVGSARFGSGPDTVEVRITPKIGIHRLLFLVGYDPVRWDWREPEVDAAEYPDLLPAVAQAFVRAAERALRHGVLLGYRETEEALSTVRGRIREADQCRRRYGLPLPLEVRYDDYTVDIAENRLLLAAAVRLLRLPGVPGPIRKQLRRLRQRLDGVSAVAPGGELPGWLPNRLNARYHTALGLAELVLRGGSYELADGSTVRVDGLLLWMWRVFENFVTLALSDALRPHGGRCGLQDRHRLFRREQVWLRPDLVYYQAESGGREEPVSVLDVKYKIEQNVRGNNSDRYQILAYCTVLGLARGHLVYAEGATAPTTHVVNGPQDIQIVQHALDLNQPPPQLLAQIGALATQLVDRKPQTTT